MTDYTSQAPNYGQLPPYVDTIVADRDLTGDYQTQLNTVAPVPLLVTFTTVVPSTMLVVTPQGTVTTTSSLEIGTYTVSGTWVDTATNTGAWQFDLNVTEIVSPESSVVPGVGPTSPLLFTGSGVEMKVPFQIDAATGGVAAVSDYYTVIEQRVKSIILTLYGERLMLSTYGSNLSNLLFAPMNNGRNAVEAADIKSAVAKWEPSASIYSVKINTNMGGKQPGILSVDIEYSVVPFKNLNSMTVNVGGSVTQVSSL